jgi:SAM-dependent methyltransferase
MAGPDVDAMVLERLRFSAYDLPTRDKIPVIRELMGVDRDGLAVDIGAGTGYTTYRVFGDRPIVCVDLDAANLRYYRDHLAAVPGARRPLCVVAAAAALPFKNGSFRFALCSEVLEHVEDDAGAAAELSRVLVPGGRAVVTVPYTGLGFTSFLELLRIKTVHDFPGPECHVRPGYDEESLRRAVSAHGLRVERYAYYLRFFTRVTTDLVSIGHLLYQRLVHRRRSWTWADAVAAEQTSVFRLHQCMFPLLFGLSRLDRLLLASWRGFGLVAALRKP